MVTWVKLCESVCSTHWVEISFEGEFLFLNLCPQKIFLLEKYRLDLCADHVISTGCLMTNLLLNVCFDFFQPTWKSDLKVVQSTKNDLFWVRHPYNTLNVPQIVKLGRSKKDNNKYLTFNTNFNIQHSVQMTWTRHKCEGRAQSR